MAGHPPPHTRSTNNRQGPPMQGPTGTDVNQANLGTAHRKSYGHASDRVTPCYWCGCLGEVTS